ncbi:MAG TPA: ABC transporter permease [Gammaproteobacteria bacterium]|nr:ABC transporter permease [Gammaproteobacteria bacterium]
MEDLRFAMRALARRPTYTIITVLVLALAIGANTTVFSVFNGFFLRPLPYPDGDRLVFVYDSYPKIGLDMAGTAIPDYVERREQAPSLEELAIFTGTQRTLGGQGDPERISVPRVSPSLFDVLGIRPMLGRTFSDDEATIGNDRVVVLSHTLWQTRFGGQADIVGRDVRLDGEAFTVVGVMPDGFGFPNQNARAWVPFAFTQEQMTDDERGTQFSASIGRLKPGATLEGLNTELDAIVQRNLQRLPEFIPWVESSGFTGRARFVRDVAVGNLKQMLLVLQAIVFAVLLIACANVANLQLARMAARRKELAVRAVLGARRGRLATLVLGESLALSALGAVAGLVLAYGGLELVRNLGLDRTSQGFEFALDPTVLVFTAGAALLAAVVSALLPVIALWRDNLGQSIQEAGRLGGGGRAAQTFRSSLVILQIAISVALLTGAGLLTKSFYALQQQGPGFNAESLLTARVGLPQHLYQDDSARARFYERALEELRALPGVSHAAFASVVPFSGSNSQGSVVIDGYTPPEGASPPHTQIRAIDEQYLPALEVPIIKGRNFASRETEPVAIVDENMAHKYWPHGDALGQRLRRTFDAENAWHTVVGVVPAIKHGSLTEDPKKETIYWHYLQRPTPGGVFTLRTTLPPKQLQRAANDAVMRIDPDLPLFDVRTLDERLAMSLGPQRTPMVLTLVFATVAFVLAVIGVYGMLTWAVTQRVGEIGVRMALGAKTSDIVRLVVRNGGRLTAIGLLLGVVAAVALGQLMAAQIHDVSPLDPQVFVIVLVGLAAAAMLASWLPARRAGRIDPMVALREE